MTDDYAEPCVDVPKRLRTYEAASALHAWEEAERAAVQLMELAARMYAVARLRNPQRGDRG